MGYIIALIVLVLAIPLIFLLLGRRTRAGGGIESRDHGLTVSEPSSDEPTPLAENTQPSTPEVSRRLPPA